MTIVAFSVREGDDRRCEVSGLQQDALSVEPLIFGGGDEHVAHVAPSSCKRCLDLVDRHDPTLNFFK